MNKKSYDQQNIKKEDRRRTLKNIFKEHLQSLQSMQSEENNLARKEWMKKMQDSKKFV